MAVDERVDVAAVVGEDDGGDWKERFGIVVDDNKPSVGVCRRLIWAWPKSNGM